MTLSSRQFTTDSDFVEAERRLAELRARLQAGEIDDDMFRLEVAKLLLRDEHGVFWMIEAGSGQWFCHQGHGWRPGDPGISRPAAPPAGPGGERALSAPPRSRRAGFLVAAALAALALGIVAAGLIWRWPAGLWRISSPTPTTAAAVQVVIASPADGSEVVVGRDVAVESTILPGSDPRAVAWVELLAGEEVVERQAMPAQAVEHAGRRDGQPVWLSQVWRPAAPGRISLTVVALGPDGRRLGSAGLTVQAVRAGQDVPLSPDCVPAAGDPADVTIPPGMAFPPGARMDKVWQVRNTGSCAWGPGYELVWVGGRQLGPAGSPAIDQPPGPPGESLDVPPTAAGEQVDLAITFWAPAAGGVYTTVWQLRSPGGDFFGPKLALEVTVEGQAKQRRPPAAPANLRAELAAAHNGPSVRLAWEDRSEDEDAFRIYREDVEAGIGLAPLNAESFLDEQVVCGQSYRYTVVAFNAAGGSASDAAEISMPACAPAGLPPTLALTVTPAEAGPWPAFTVEFTAAAGLGVAQVWLWGEQTGDPAIDAGVVITCSDLLCRGAWPLSWTGPASATLLIAGIAIDTSGQESEPSRVTVAIRPP